MRRLAATLLFLTLTNAAHAQQLSISPPYIFPAGLAWTRAMAQTASPWPVVPDPAKTPGKVCVTDLAKICGTKWGKDERLVTDTMKQQVFDAYGIPSSARHLPDGKAAFEVDHLVSRELGGCDATENLWSEPYTGPWNAHMKDRIENRLHAEVCAGRLSLPDAQAEIVADWRVPYVRYFGNPP